MADELMFGEFGTGALPRPADWRDYSIACAPGIAPLVGAAPESDDHLLRFIKGVYNQGAVPSCVAHSSAAMQSINEQMERGQWVTMDAPRCYRDNGGTGSNGVDTQRVLSYMQSQGMPVMASTLRYKLASYAFAQPMQPGGVEAIKAAIATGHPCVLAMLLPLDFMSGMAAGVSDVNPQAYHQVCLVAYTRDRVTYLNSWGPQYGNQGLGSVPWAYLQRPEQQGYVYAFTEIDAPDEDSTPLPLPPPPPPPPPPVELSISGYQGAAGMTPQFKGGGPLTILGKGLNVGVLQVTFGARQLPVGPRSSASALVTLPAVEVPTCGVIRVQSEAMAISGPLLVVMPNGAPPPPDGIVVQLVSKRFSTGIVSVYAAVHNAAGAFLDATCTGTAGAMTLPPRNALANGTPAAWGIRAAAGTTVTIKAVTAAGTTGRATATL